MAAVKTKNPTSRVGFHDWILQPAASPHFPSLYGKPCLICRRDDERLFKTWKVYL